MYSNFQMAKKFLRYHLAASNAKGHGMHSPFVFDFILNVLNNRSGYASPLEVEQLRGALLRDGRSLLIEDLGAGSRTAATRQRTVSQLARSALKPPKYAQLLYRLAKHYKPSSIIELGTSLGLTTAYLSKANPLAAITTIEGSEAIAGVARNNLSTLGCTNVESLTGNFDAVLPAVLRGLNGPLGLGYIDGNHRYAPTVDYFEQMLGVAGSHTILVFDDIHWSQEMEKAWEQIKAHPRVVYTIDIFFLGFVFFRSEFKVKQDFAVRF